MPCHPIHFPGGGTGIVCTAPMRRRRCGVDGCHSWWCEVLCDWPVPGKGKGGKPKTCDRPVCEKHRVKLGPDLDHCWTHVQMAAGDRQVLAAELRRQASHFQEATAFINHRDGCALCRGETKPEAMCALGRDKRAAYRIAFARANGLSPAALGV
jgi:hypothetical protein